MEALKELEDEIKELRFTYFHVHKSLAKHVENKIHILQKRIKEKLDRIEPKEEGK